MHLLSFELVIRVRPRCQHTPVLQAARAEAIMDGGTPREESCAAKVAQCVCVWHCTDCIRDCIVLDHQGALH